MHYGGLSVQHDTWSPRGFVFYGRLGFGTVCLIRPPKYWLNVIPEFLSDWSFQPAVTVFWAAMLAVICLMAWGLNLVSLPGNWVAIAALALYVWLGPKDGRAGIGLPVLVIVFVLGLLGEAIELLAAAMGAKRAGASRRSTLFALIGSMAGAIFGAFVGIPVPAVGSILAAILFGGAGATIGAMYGEWSDGRPWRESWAVGHAAFWGRTFGMLGKLAAGVAIVFVILASLVL